MSLIFWIVREFCALSNALDDYFFGPTRVLPNGRRRVLELEQPILEHEDAEEWREEELDEIEDDDEWIQEQLDEIEERRQLNLVEIESIMNSRKELKAMRIIKNRLNLSVSYIKLREFIVAARKLSTDIEKWETKHWKDRKIKSKMIKRYNRQFDRAWHILYIDEKRLIAAIYYNVSLDDDILFHRFNDEEYAWDLFEDPANDFLIMRELLRIHYLWRKELDNEISIYHKRKRASPAA